MVSTFPIIHGPLNLLSSASNFILSLYRAHSRRKTNAVQTGIAITVDTMQMVYISRLGLSKFEYVPGGGSNPGLIMIPTCGVRSEETSEEQWLR